MSEKREAMLEPLANYDWEEVFKYSSPQVVMGGNCPGTPFAREDVAEIIALVNGENDGDPWIALFRLKDGRYAYIEAGCDYTGWG